MKPQFCRWSDKYAIPNISERREQHMECKLHRDTNNEMTLSTAYISASCVVGFEVSKQPPWSIEKPAQHTTEAQAICLIISFFVQFWSRAPGRTGTDHEVERDYNHSMRGENTAQKWDQTEGPTLSAV